MFKFALSVAVSCVAATLSLADGSVSTNGFVRDGVAYSRRGALGKDDFVVTNVAERTGEGRYLPKYLHLYQTDDVYTNDAAWYYSQPRDYGNCSAVKQGNYLYRNFDFLLDERAEFVVSVSGNDDRFASVGVANCGTNLTERFVSTHQPSRYYKALAGSVVDGINENGVAVEINLVDGEPEWENPSGDIHPLAAVRWTLDNAKDALDAATNLATRIVFPQGWTQNFHWLVCDTGSCYVVENGSYSNMAGRAVMTNFKLNPKTYGTGWERYMLLEDTFASITNAWYTRAYSRDTEWVSEFKSLTEMEAAKHAWETHTKEQLRGKGLWQTLHTSVYDLQRKTLCISVQETDDWYVFSVPTAGKVKSVNGRTGEVVLDAEDVNAIPDDYDKLVENTNFSNAVVKVSPPVDAYTKEETDSLLNHKLGNGSEEGVSALWNNGQLTFSDGAEIVVERHGFAGTEDVVIKQSGTGTELHRLSEKADRAESGHADEIATLDTDGNPKSSGKKVSDFLPATCSTLGFWNVGTEYGNVDWITFSCSYFEVLQKLQIYGTFGILSKNSGKWYYGSATDENEIAVKGDIKPLPQNWALANITNANGQAVGAADVGAVASNSLVDWKMVRKESFGGGYVSSYRLRIYSDDAGIDDSEYAVEIDPINFYYVNSYDGNDYQFDNGFRVQNGSLCSNFGSDRIDWASYGSMYELYFPQETGTIALEGYRSLSRSLTDARTNHTAECESISTNICKLIEPHIEPVNVIAELYDAKKETLWAVKMINGEMKITAATNEDTTVFLQANSVLKDKTLDTNWKIKMEDGEMKFNALLGQ